MDGSARSCAETLDDNTEFKAKMWNRDLLKILIKVCRALVMWTHLYTELGRGAAQFDARKTRGRPPTTWILVFGKEKPLACYFCIKGDKLWRNGAKWRQDIKVGWTIVVRTNAEIDVVSAIEMRRPIVEAFLQQKLLVPCRGKCHQVAASVVQETKVTTMTRL